MSNNKDFKVKNGIKPTVYHEAVGTVVSGSVGYSLANASYDSKSFSVAAQETGPSGIFLKPDGTKVYICGFTGDEINEYDLSTAYDISTATFNQLFSIVAQEGSSRQVFFKLDGTSMYVVGVVSDTVYQYTLSTAWDISTASYASKSFSVVSQDTAPAGLSFKSDGTKMYVSGSASGNNVYQYSLSTAWDVSTASYDSVSFTAAGVSALRGVWFSSDGTYLYLVDAGTGHVFKATLGIAWDLSTASMTSETLDVSGQDLTIYNVYGSSDGTKLYLMGSANDTIYQYSTVLNTATLDLSTGSVFELTPTSDIQVSLSNPAASGTVSGATLLLDGVATSTYSYASETLLDSITPQATAGQAYWRADGLKFYHINDPNENVYQYACSRPYDLSTATYETFFNDSVNMSAAKGLFFKPDGTKMYTSDQNTDKVHEYTLSTAWDVSTASYASSDLSVLAQTTYASNIFFSSDGVYLYVMDNTNDAVDQWTLSTAWDVSTGSYTRTFSVAGQETNPLSLHFSDDGATMFVSGGTGQDLNVYSLSTAWNISTASFVQAVAMSALSTNAGYTNMSISKGDYEGYYILGGNTTYSRYQIADIATITYDTAIQWAGGTAPTSPAIGETDVLTFTTRDGGTTYNAALAIDGAQ